ncbi:MAG: nuclear transport factor 2 family protein [Lysobacteraceae bacterium]|nr:MAG: nuclear transport factor 2 family protein [Xanthomonadaceae bacterium]
MTTQTEIMALERKFWQSVADMDVETAISLLDEQSTTAGAQGIHYFSPAEYKAMAQAGSARITSFDFFEEKVIFPTPDVAIASYKAKQSFTMAGKRPEQVVYDTTTWIRKGGNWLACAHTETREQKDPSAT